MATVVNKRIAYTSQPLSICVKGLSDDYGCFSGGPDTSQRYI